MNINLNLLIMKTLTQLLATSLHNLEAEIDECECPLERDRLYEKLDETAEEYAKAYEEEH
jgi:hypothetical protein